MLLETFEAHKQGPSLPVNCENGWREHLEPSVSLSEHLDGRCFSRRSRRAGQSLVSHWSLPMLVEQKSIITELDLKADIRY